MINAKIDMSDTRVLLRLESLPRDLQNRLAETLEGFTAKLANRVRANQPRVTGRLRRQTHAYVDNNTIKMFVRSRVRVLNMRSTNIAAGFGALEYGSTGRAFPVQGYTRGNHPVRGYTRVGGIREERFLRSAMAAMAPQARELLQRAIREGLQEP